MSGLGRGRLSNTICGLAETLKLSNTISQIAQVDVKKELSNILLKVTTAKAPRGLEPATNIFTNPLSNRWATWCYGHICPSIQVAMKIDPESWQGDLCGQAASPNRGTLVSH